MTIKIRKSLERGHANHGWLNTFHSFSFADYYAPKFNGFRSLRVLNEDFIAEGQGFPTHPHSNYEIFSYVAKGAIAHKDSMGNKEICKRGDVQFTSAGTGIMHSEFSERGHGNTHILQLWVKPNVSNLKPSYSTLTVTDEQKLNALAPIITPEGTGETIKINQQFSFFASILERDHTIEHKLLGADPRHTGAYLHVVMNDPDNRSPSQVLINDELVVSSGDAVFIEGEHTISIKSLSPRAEFVLMDFH